MALLNIFKPKKKKIEKKPSVVKVSEDKKEKKEKVGEPKPRKVETKTKRISEMAYRVLETPQVTEKATDLAGKNQYVFKVKTRANKKDIKRTVEDVFGVDVLKVKVIKVPPKKRRLGRTEGWRKSYKKAIIRIKEGQKIEVLPR